MTCTGCGCSVRIDPESGDLVDDRRAVTCRRGPRKGEPHRTSR